MQIVIRIKDVFGKRTIYPVCDKAKLFAELAGTRTLTQMALLSIQKLGYEVKCEQVTL